MATCNNCGKKIKYNQFKRWRKKLLCPECYKIRSTLKNKVTEEANVSDIITNPEDAAVFFSSDEIIKEE